VVKENRDGTQAPYRFITLGERCLITRTTATWRTLAPRSRKLFPTDIGMVVNDFLVEHFPTIVDLNFTA
jgi:DNA topoisomerase-1